MLTLLLPQFCKQCDVGVVGEHLTGPLTRQFVVNVRTLQGVNPFAIEYEYFQIPIPSSR